MVQFNYLGPTGSPEDHEASELAWDLSFKIEKTLKNAKLEYRHAYAFPDGSMYKYIKSNFYYEQLRGTIINALKKNCLFVNIDNYNYDDDKFKCIIDINIDDVTNYKHTNKAIENFLNNKEG